MGSLAVVVLAMLLAAVAGQHNARLAFQVEPRAKECFFLEVAANEAGEVTLDVAVIKGGLLDIMIDVHDHAGNKLFSRMFFEGKGSSEIKFLVEKPGDYQVCFNNEMARWTAKVVAMRMNLSKNAKKAGDEEPVTPSDVTPLDSKLDELELLMDRILEEQAKFKDREAAHSASLASTHSRVTYYSLLESAVLLALSGVQIYLVKRWFETNTSGRGRV